MATRKSTGKRLRFEIFERDSYTCRYCGAQPPAVVLVADHVLPVKENGQTSADNLVTACEACNQGKADRVIGAFPPTPDTDLRYLKTQQEIAELRRYHESLDAREAAISGIAESLQAMWSNETGLAWVPAEHIIRQGLGRYSPDVVEEALRATGRKCGDGTVKRGEWWRYFWGCARNIAEQSVCTEQDAEVAEILSFAYAQYFTPEAFATAVREFRADHPLNGSALEYWDWAWSSVLGGMGRLARTIHREREKGLEIWYRRDEAAS